MSALLGALAQFEPVEQPQLFAARQLQALSLGFHIIIVCFAITFPAMTMFAEWRWLRTGDRLYRTIAHRWSRIMVVLFAVGAVSGTILSFEFGILWPEFMATFGDVFGVSFALEGYAFFIEAIFIAIYLYGWDRLPPKVHFLTGIPVVIGGTASAYFVIAVNGWMNEPVGFTIDANGEVTDINTWAVLTGNSFMWHELAHMLLAGVMVAGFLLGTVYAWCWLKGARTRYHRTAATIALSFATIATPLQLIAGDAAGQYIAANQPVKLAAAEALEETTANAPFSLGGIVVDGELEYAIEIPDLLSLLAFRNPNATVQGLDSVPPEDQPPVNVVHLAFDTMVMIGTALAGLALWWGLAWWRRKQPPQSRWFWRFAVAAGPASVVALIAGWIVTEVGRQPWIVYEVMRTEDAVTAADGIGVLYAVMVVVYALLGTATLFVLARLARRPLPGQSPGGEDDPAGLVAASASSPGAASPSSVGAS